MKTTAICVAALLGVAACTTTADDSMMGVMSSSMTGIVISTAGLGVNSPDAAYSAAGQIASAHCATYGLNAVFTMREPAGMMMPDAIHYACE